MKKYVLLYLVALSTLILVSWGFTGHRTVAFIAANHLTPQAKAAVAGLLNGQSMADVSTWADEVRSQPEYKHTAGWHFLNQPLGLDRAAFDKAVESDSKENVLTAINAAIQGIANLKNSKEQRAEALKFLIHFVGDAHQPMHISSAEDKGGNTIQVQFEGKGTNLHSLWDSRLLDKQGLSDVQMATQLDKATPELVKQWQNESRLTWMYESYQISGQLYSEVKSGSKLDDAYYQTHIAIANERMVKAGVRLAGILNAIFTESYINMAAYMKLRDSASVTKTVSEDAVYILAKDAVSNVGKMAAVSGQVFGSRDMGSFVLVNVGAAYPNQLLTVVLRGEAKKLGPNLDGKTIRVSGKITEYKGKPQIEVTDPNMINLIHLLGGSGRKGG